MRSLSRSLKPRPAAWAGLVVLVLALAPAPSAAQESPKYHAFTELTAALRGLTDAHKAVARLESIGKTLGGRGIWAVEVANPAATPVPRRPALLIAAGLEGDQLVGSEIALSVIEFLLENYPANAELKQRLESSVIYVVPRVNPDGAEGYFSSVKAGRKTNAVPRDEDNDGRLDEAGTTEALPKAWAALADCSKHAQFCLLFHHLVACFSR